MKKENPKKIAVLGAGSIGLRHIRNLLDLGVSVVAYDPDPERCRLVKQEGGAVADSRDQALQDLTAAVVATPNACHAEDLAAVVDARCHAFVEKPLATFVEDLEGTLKKAKDQNLIVSVGLNLRFNPVIQRAKALLDAGVLGRLTWARLQVSLYLPSWRTGKDYRQGYTADPRTGGAMFDLIHEFDLANHFFGEAEVVAAVARQTGILEIPSEDIANIILRHEGGVFSTLHLDFVTQPPLRIAEISGEKGRLRLDIRRRTWAQYDINGQLVAGAAVETSINDDYKLELEEFLQNIRHYTEPACDGFQRLEVLSQLCRARELAGLPSG